MGWDWKIGSRFYCKPKVGDIYRFDWPEMGTLRDGLGHAIALRGTVRAMVIVAVLVLVTRVIIMTAVFLSRGGHRRSIAILVVWCCGEIFEEMVHPMRRGGDQKKDKNTDYA